MRDGLDAPTLALPPDDLRDLRAFFDAQSRVELAVWVRHEQQGADGPAYDHHLMLGVPDEDYEIGDMRALELGLPLPGLRFEGPTWTDIFPLSEVEALRAFGTLVWEYDPASSAAADRLDYRLTYEPLDELPVDLRALLAGHSLIRRVVGTRECLWKGDAEVESTPRLYVEAAGAGDPVHAVHEIARRAGLQSFAIELGLPNDPRIRTATLYEAA